MRSPTLHFLSLVSAGAAVGAAHARQDGAPAPQAEGGPVVVGEAGKGWKAFELDTFAAAIEFNGRSRRDTLKQPGQPDVVDTQTQLREFLDLSSRSFIGHKNLVDLTARVRLGIEDRYTDSDTTGLDVHQDDFTDLFDINARILGASRVPIDVYTRRDEQFLDRDFASSVTTTMTETGVIANMVSAVAPTTFRVFRNQSDQENDLGQSEYDYTQDGFSAQSNIALGAQNRLEVAYSYDDIHETQPGLFVNDYERHDLALTEISNFGATKNNELRSYFRYFDQSGRFGLESTQWDEQLRLTHSPNLESRYHFGAERRSQLGVDQDLVVGSATLQHKLFKSLVSTGTVGARRFSTSEDFDSDEWYLQGSLEYTKKTPKGRIDASAGLSYNAQHNSEQGGIVAIIDEVHVFNDPFPIVLARRNIVVGSVVVTAAAGFPTFQEGIDYIVRYSPDRAEIDVIVGAGVSDGQTLLIDYQLGPQPASDIDTIGQNISLRYTFTEGAFRGLSIYSSYRTNDNDLSTVDPSLFALDDTQDLLYGAEYRVGGMLARAEREDHDSSVNPYDIDRLQLTYDMILGPASTLGLDATQEWISFSNPENEINFARVSLRWLQRVNSSLDFQARVGFRDEHNDLSGDTQGFEQLVGFTWRKNQTTLFATFRNSLLDAEQSDTMSQFLEFGLRRNF